MAAGFSDLVRISRELTESGIVHALGGSGLMFVLGLDVEVGDWDLTTDAPEEMIAGIVQRYPHRRLSQHPFLSRYAFRLRVGDSDVDLVGGFAVEHGPDRVELRTIVVGHSEGVPLGCANEWIKVYRAIGETQKAELLEELQS